MLGTATKHITDLHCGSFDRVLILKAISQLKRRKVNTIMTSSKYKRMDKFRQWVSTMPKDGRIH